MTDERYDLTSRLAANILAKAEELSTAIYEAGKYGYATKIAIYNVIPIEKGDSSIVCLGADRPCIVVKATIPFDIGRAV